MSAPNLLALLTGGLSAPQAPPPQGAPTSPPASSFSSEPVASSSLSPSSSSPSARPQTLDLLFRQFSTSPTLAPPGGVNGEQVATPGVVQAAQIPLPVTPSGTVKPGSPDNRGSVAGGLGSSGSQEGSSPSGGPQQGQMNPLLAMLTGAAGAPQSAAGFSSPASTGAVSSTSVPPVSASSLPSQHSDASTEAALNPGRALLESLIAGAAGSTQPSASSRSVPGTSSQQPANSPSEVPSVHRATVHSPSSEPELVNPPVEGAAPARVVVEPVTLPTSPQSPSEAGSPGLKSPGVVSPPERASTKPSNATSPFTSTGPTPPEQPTPASRSTATPTMFDFVSPFDILARGTGSPSTSPGPAPTQTPLMRKKQPKTASPSSPSPLGRSVNAGQTKAIHRPAQAPHSHLRSASNISNLSEGQEKIISPPARGVTAMSPPPPPARDSPVPPSVAAPGNVSPPVTSVAGNALRAIDRSMHAVNDVSRSNLSSFPSPAPGSRPPLLSNPVPVTEPSKLLDTLHPEEPECTPIALLPSPYINTHGRSWIGVSSALTPVVWKGMGDSTCADENETGLGLVVYCLSKGRLRLIDQNNGHRALLKAPGGSGIVDLTVLEHPDGVHVLLAVATHNGMVVVWSVPRAFAGDGPRCDVLFELVGEPSENPDIPRFTRLKWTLRRVRNELEPHLLVSVNDSTIISLNVNEVSRQEPLSEELARNVSPNFHVASPLVDFAVSPDGTTLASLSVDHTVVLCRADVSSEDIRVLKPDADYADKEPASSISFVSDRRLSDELGLRRREGPGRPTHLVIGSNGNSRLAFVEPVGGEAIAVWEFEHGPVEPPPIVHPIFHEPSGTLLLSHSLRASMFAFQLGARAVGMEQIDEQGIKNGTTEDKVEDADRDLSTIDDATLLQRELFKDSEGRVYLRGGLGKQKKTLQLELDILSTREFALPEPTINYVVSSFPSSSFTGTAKLAAAGEGGSVATSQSRGLDVFAVHPGGIHRLRLPAEALGWGHGKEEPAAEEKRTEEAEVVAQTAHLAVEVDEVPAVMSTAASVTHSTGDVKSSAAAPTTTTTASAPVATSIQPPTPSTSATGLNVSDADFKLAGPVVNGAIRNLKKAANKAANAKDAADVQQGQTNGGASVWGAGRGTLVSTSDNADKVDEGPAAVVTTTATQRGGKGKGRQSGKEKEKEKEKDTGAKTEGAGDEFSAQQLTRIEGVLVGRMERLLSTEMGKIAARMEEERLASQAAEVARQETLLRLISNELTKNTTRVLESIVRKEIQASVLPAVHNLVREAVGQQLARGLDEAMRGVLPNELQKLLLRPDVSSHLVRGIQNGVIPLFERQIKQSISTTLIPAYSNATDHMLHMLLKEVHAEITGVRKTIVAEQSEALKEAQTAIESTAEAMRGLQEQMKVLTRNNEQHGQALRTLSERRGSISSTAALPQHQPPQPQPQHHQAGHAQTSLGQLPTSATPSHPLGGFYAPTALTGALPQARLSPLPPAATTSAFVVGATAAYPTQLSGQWPLQQPSVPPTPTDVLGFSQPPRAQRQEHHRNVSQFPQAPQAPTDPQSLPQQQSRAPAQQDWEDIFLKVLSADDPAQVDGLLDSIATYHGGPGAIFRFGGRPQLSQAVLLTLVHRLISTLATASPATADKHVRWLDEALRVLDGTDSSIATYYPKVIGLGREAVEKALRERRDLREAGLGAKMDELRGVLARM